jgi:hypothetical protein
MGMTTDRMYEVRITGVVPDVALHELDDIEVARQEMRTVLSGRFTDQAALYGFLHRLRSLGLEVVEVRQVAADGTLDHGVGPEAAEPARDSEATDDPEQSR